ncbi:SWIM zinc finger domain-containing protein [Paenibacillus sp. GCM10027627]|uniref:SWIM zinc finger family protein n=1 Tax=unclassified Paenibacillus TaxID=185978 RepID=UPI003640D720
MHLDHKLYAALERQIGQSIPIADIKRGWSYYKQGNVHRAEPTLQDTLTGIVKGEALYSVVMDSEHFAYSSCTCPDGGYCKHMAAVFFQFCETHEGGSGAAEKAYFRLIGLTAASSLLQQESGGKEPEAPLHPGENDTAENWLSWMRQEHGETWRKCRHSLHALQPVLSALKGLSRDWPKPLQRLHWSTSIMFVLEQSELAITTVDSFSRYYHELSFARMAEPWLEHAYTLIDELEPDEMSEAEWIWSRELIAFAKEYAARQERTLFDWSQLYLRFCKKFAANAKWRELELQELQNSLKSTGEMEQNHSFLNAACGMLCFFIEDDDRSIDYFTLASFEKTQRLIYPCAEARMQEQEWDKAEKWMAFIYEKVYAIRNGRNIGPFMALCRKADEGKPEQPIWTVYMTELLPYSYTELSEHWMKIGRFEDWADLQMFVQVKAEDISAQELKEMTKSAPHALLPLYHQSIEAAVASRNRQGYRLAVKQLKKLEKIYKALKETDKWQQFLSELTTKTLRLRAFQEELWKGKMIE